MRFFSFFFFLLFLFFLPLLLLLLLLLLLFLLLLLLRKEVGLGRPTRGSRIGTSCGKFPLPASRSLATEHTTTANTRRNRRNSAFKKKTLRFQEKYSQLEVRYSCTASFPQISQHARG